MAAARRVARACSAMARLPTALIGALALARGMPTAPDGTLVPFDGSLELEKDYFKDNCKSKNPAIRASKCCVHLTPSCYALEAGVDVEDDFSDCGKYFYLSKDGSPKACRNNKHRCGQTGRFTHTTVRSSVGRSVRRIPRRTPSS